MDEPNINKEQKMLRLKEADIKDDSGYHVGYKDQKDMEECQQKSSEEFVREMERDGAFPSSYAERSYSERGEIVVEDTMKRHSKKDE